MPWNGPADFTSEFDYPNARPFKRRYRLHLDVMQICKLRPIVCDFLRWYLCPLDVFHALPILLTAKVKYRGFGYSQEHERVATIDPPDMGPFSTAMASLIDIARQRFPIFGRTFEDRISCPIGLLVDVIAKKLVLFHDAPSSNCEQLEDDFRTKWVS